MRLLRSIVCLLAIVLALETPISAGTISIPFPGPGTPAELPIGTPSVILNNGSSVAGTTFVLATTANIVAAVPACFIAQWNASTGATFVVSSVSDGTNSYTKAVEKLTPDGFVGTSAWCNFSPSAVLSGANITFSFGGVNSSGTNWTIQGFQVTGVTAVDVFNSASANSNTTVSAATGTLGASRAIIIGAATNAGTASYSGASGFTSAMTPKSQSSTTSAIDYKQVSATTTQTYSPVFTVAGRISAVVFALK